MAVTTVKSTYSLDVESVRTLKALAERWNVSKSEVIRRALRIAVMAGDDTHHEVPLDALTRLQNTIRDRGVDLAEWGRDVHAERAATGRRLRWGGE